MSYQMNRKFSIAINPCQPVSFSLCESIQRVQYTIAKKGGCGLKQCYSAPTFCLVRLLYSFNLGTSVPSGALQGGWTFLDFAGKKGDSTFEKRKNLSKYALYRYLSYLICMLHPHLTD